MKILVASSEMTPFARTGGLADAVTELTSELVRLGHDVSVVIPYYRSIREGKSPRRRARIRFNVQIGNAGIPAEVFETKTSEGVQVFLVARDEYFDRSGFYGVDGRDYQDNSARFIYFTKSVVELAGRMDPAPADLTRQRLANGAPAGVRVRAAASISHGFDAAYARLSGEFLELRFRPDEFARRLLFGARRGIFRKHELS